MVNDILLSKIKSKHNLSGQENYTIQDEVIKDNPIYEKTYTICTNCYTVLLRNELKHHLTVCNSANNLQQLDSQHNEYDNLKEIFCKYCRKVFDYQAEYEHHLLREHNLYDAERELNDTDEQSDLMDFSIFTYNDFLTNYESTQELLINQEKILSTISEFLLNYTKLINKVEYIMICLNNGKLRFISDDNKLKLSIQNCLRKQLTLILKQDLIINNICNNLREKNQHLQKTKQKIQHVLETIIITECNMSTGINIPSTNMTDMNKNNPNSIIANNVDDGEEFEVVEVVEVIDVDNDNHDEDINVQNVYTCNSSKDYITNKVVQEVVQESESENCIMYNVSAITISPENNLELNDNYNKTNETDEIKSIKENINIKQIVNNVKMNDNQKYPCKWCNVTFRSRYSLKPHILRVHRKEKLKICEICKRSFSCTGDLTRHIRSHTGDKPFKCTYPDCKYAFAGSGDLYKHIKRHNESTRRRDYCCEICERSFERMYDLKRHKQLHNVHDEKPFTCSTCNKGFTRKDHYTAHLNRHSMLHQCHVCGKFLVHNTSYTIHMNKHLEYKNAKNRPTCENCNYGFRSKYCIQQHFNWCYKI